MVHCEAMACFLALSRYDASKKTCFFFKFWRSHRVVRLPQQIFHGQPTHALPCHVYQAGADRCVLGLVVVWSTRVQES